MAPHGCPVHGQPWPFHPGHEQRLFRHHRRRPFILVGRPSGDAEAEDSPDVERDPKASQSADDQYHLLADHLRPAHVRVEHPRVRGHRALQEPVPELEVLPGRRDDRHAAGDVFRHRQLCLDGIADGHRAGEQEENEDVGRHGRVPGLFGPRHGKIVPLSVHDRDPGDLIDSTEDPGEANAGRLCLHGTRDIHPRRHLPA